MDRPQNGEDSAFQIKFWTDRLKEEKEGRAFSWSSLHFSTTLLELDDEDGDGKRASAETPRELTYILHR